MNQALRDSIHRHFGKEYMVSARRTLAREEITGFHPLKRLRRWAAKDEASRKDTRLINAAFGTLLAGTLVSMIFSPPLFIAAAVFTGALGVALLHENRVLKARIRAEAVRAMNADIASGLLVKRYKHEVLAPALLAAHRAQKAAPAPQNKTKGKAKSAFQRIMENAERNTGPARGSSYRP